jgi:hypothetical protein
MDPEFTSRPGLPEVMCETHFLKDQFENALYSVGPDGDRFVVVRSEAPFFSTVRVITNWFEELEP